MWNNDRWSRGLALTNGVTIPIICDECNLGRLHKFYTASFLFTKMSIFLVTSTNLNKWWIWTQEMQKRIGRRAREKERDNWVILQVTFFTITQFETHNIRKQNWLSVRGLAKVTQIGTAAQTFSAKKLAK